MLAETRTGSSRSSPSSVAMAPPRLPLPSTLRSLCSSTGWHTGTDGSTNIPVNGLDKYRMELHFNARGSDASSSVSSTGSISSFRTSSMANEHAIASETDRSDYDPDDSPTKIEPSESPSPPEIKSLCLFQEPMSTQEPYSGTHYDRSGQSDLATNPNLSSQVKPEQVSIPPKKKRGRPRKTIATPSRPAPVLALPPAKKTTHTRTKTGCQTCRKRKKKCDETRPTCYHCRNGGYECEGYLEPVQWRPGARKRREYKKALDDLVEQIPTAPPHYCPGIETDIDQVLFEHYYCTLSRKLTTKPENNPFLSLILPLAKDDEVVTHALLGVAGAHYLRQIHRDGSHDFQWTQYAECKGSHIDKAINQMRTAVGQCESVQANVSDAIVVCLILQLELQRIEGCFDGAYLTHYRFARDYVKFRVKEPVGRFADEYFKYNEMAFAMTSIMVDPARPSEATPEGSTGWQSLFITYDDINSPDDTLFPLQEPVANGCDGVMLGSLNGLFPLIARISELRSDIRARKRSGQRPAVDHENFFKGSLLHHAVKRWDSQQEEGSEDWYLADLYRWAALVYLHRTIHSSKPDQCLSGKLNRGTFLLEALSDKASFSQCVLLLPTFILGCAAFARDERERIWKVFQSIASASNFGNVELSMKIVQRVWQMMDDHNEDSWDWESIRKEMRCEFPIT